jgi:hypothetical protein
VAIRHQHASSANYAADLAGHRLGVFAPLASNDVNPPINTGELQAMLICPMQQGLHIPQAAPAGSQIDTISNL